MELKKDKKLFIDLIYRLKVIKLKVFLLNFL